MMQALPVWLSLGIGLSAASGAENLEQQAKEILARRCLACHSGRMKMSGLDLSSRASALDGGVKGGALKPGEASASLMIARIESGQMPPAKPLPAAEQELLRRWVEQGAPWSGGGIAERRGGSDWWALQPLREAAAPVVEGVVNPIDRWVRTKLSARGLRPSPAADARTLIRRISFDLTGLPPTPEGIAAFVADRRSDAYEREVDRLLASPHYGERWGRHWLDVVRYAESEGFERDWLRDNAWPYRDYVIRSFNEDKPYGQFVREQIAGDVIEPVSHDSVVATSLLAMGPFDAVGLTSAVPQERAQVRADQLEEIVGLVSQTFLGLTVNCARCHDHKFDPIPQRDFYRMRSVFEGVWQPATGEELRADGRGILTPAEQKGRERKLQALRKRVNELAGKLGELDRKARPAGRVPGGRPAPLAQWTFDTDALDDFGALHADSSAAFEIREGRMQPTAGKETIVLATPPLAFDLREKTLEAWIHVRQVPEKSTTLLRIRNRSGFRGAAHDGIQYAGGQQKQWENMSTVRFRTEEVAGEPEDTAAGGRIHMAITYAADGGIRIYRNGRPYGKGYRPDPTVAHGRLQTYMKGDAIVELSSSNGLELEEARIYDLALSAGQIAESFAAGVLNAGPAAGKERAQLAAELERVRRELSELPAPAKAFAVEVRTPEPTRLLLRGDVNQPGEVVSPGAVSCVKGLAADLGLAADSPEGKRRRRLAEWITNPRNPLFSRVIVNRVWHYHFGFGLVDSPNDFGFNGGEASHAELLDWLANEFIQSGGSIKKLHKMILMSETYRQSSRFDAASAAQDAGTRLLWRFPPMRLQGEAVRDAMLMASGRLNPAMYGPSFRPFQIIKNPGSYHSYEPIDSADAEFQRRTIYRMNVNSGGNPLLDALDCPLPSMKTPKRSVTTTSLQALSLMNNPFVNRMAKAFAERVTREVGQPEEAQVRRAFELALGRSPEKAEVGSSLELVREAGLESLCWSLFNSSEFLYVQ
ncbi:MAG: DUF1549 domain-containing protein [Bryobacter sp.]|jgi:hypothetical protein|nr:DUF1549 domain-containing protein [Bryobacter sp. CoA8 C33]